MRPMTALQILRLFGELVVHILRNHRNMHMNGRGSVAAVREREQILAIVTMYIGRYDNVHDPVSCPCNHVVKCKFSQKMLGSGPLVKIIYLSQMFFNVILNCITEIIPQSVLTLSAVRKATCMQTRFILFTVHPI